MKFGRAAKEGTGSLLNVLLVLGILILIQYLSYRHPHEWDFTKNKRYSLSPLSTRLLSNLKQELEFWVFTYRQDFQTRDLARQYEALSPKVRTHFIDPRFEPQRAREFGINSPPPIIVLKYGKSEEQVSQPNEEKITNAIYRITSGETRVVYFVAGHGEPDLDASDPLGLSRLKDSLVGENFVVRPLVPAKESAVPADASAFVIVDPKYPPLPKEIKLLNDYVAKGGRLLFLCGLDTDRAWSSFLSQLGFQIGDDLVIDPTIALAGYGPEVLTTNSFSPHPITDSFLKGRTAPFILIPLARMVSSPIKLPSGASITPLITTSNQGQAFKVKVQGKKIIPEVNKPFRTGALPVASAATITRTKDKPARIVVVGSNAFANNQWFDKTPVNKDFLLNAVSWLTDRSDTISIHPKSTENPPLLLDRSSMARLVLLTLVLIPGFGVLLGISSWLRRRA